MYIKKILAFGLSVALAAVLLTGCGASKNDEKGKNTQQQTQQQSGQKYKDGIYSAEEDGFDESSGWKNVVTLQVKDGKIVDAEWNAIHKDGGDDKKTLSADGKYGMQEKGGAQAEWHEQAEKVEQYLLKTQDPSDISYSDDEGHTDAISGASIHVKEFFDLAAKALKDAK
ncbi:MAG: FMN-binding protein [Acetivibrionales bacterium]|jgi:major membrane immunogen (membrane-anchored lipoprotein)